MDKELEERIDSADFKERLEKWKYYSKHGLYTVVSESEDISDLGRLIEKYQKKFNEAIKNRNEASHEAVKTGDRTLWNKYNEEAFILIDMLYDLRSLR